MGNHALRKKLSFLLKKNNVSGKLYSCTKNVAFRYLPARSLRSMIWFLENVKPGYKTHEWGVNQVVSEELNFVFIYKNNGCIIVSTDQVMYSSGYLSCGCGSLYCFLEGASLKSKEEIVKHLTNNDTPLSKIYFQALKEGVDIIDNDGFLIPNYYNYDKII